jgi:hypothetical protein
MNSRLTYRLGLLLLIFLAVSISAARADTVTFDQTNTVFAFGGLFQNVTVFSPIGQSFTPTLASLNFVNLLTEAFVPSFTLQVDIHFGSISGTILGTSLPTTVLLPSPPFANVLTPFTFSTPVSLVPGNIYVIQVLPVSVAQGLVGSSDANFYPGGTQILGGIAQPNNDLWFQEGIATPEPGMLLLLAAGLIGLLATALFGNRLIS